jgi:hypothetical protein
MAQGDEQFRLGVEHGYSGESYYQWQDRFHQDRYDAGYLVGRWSRVTEPMRTPPPATIATVDAILRRRGLKRER